MKTWLQDILDALLLRAAAFQRVIQRPDAFLRGLTVIVAVALLTGLPALVTHLVRGFGPEPIVEPGEAQLRVDEAFERVRPWLRNAGVPEGIIESILEQTADNTVLSAQIASEIQQLPTSLPRPLSETLRGLGEWFSRPFGESGFPLAAAVLTTWLGYGVWVMLAAKLLGGQGALHSFFGATAFFAAPHVLRIFSGVPVLGPALGAIALVWGLVIYVIATAVSHRLSAGRAIVAVFAPFLLLLAFVLLSLIFALFIGLILSTVSQ